jgi:hypothetical protein
MDIASIQIALGWMGLGICLFQLYLLTMMMWDNL